MIITVTTIGFEWREDKETVHYADKLYAPALWGRREIITVFRHGHVRDTGIVQQALNRTVVFEGFEEVVPKGRVLIVLESKFFMIGDELHIALGPYDPEKEYWQDMLPVAHAL